MRSRVSLSASITCVVRDVRCRKRQCASNESAFSAETGSKVSVEAIIGLYSRRPRTRFSAGLGVHGFLTRPSPGGEEDPRQDRPIGTAIVLALEVGA